MQGGASTQFSMLPLNLGTQADVTDYIVTGAWSKKAYEEGQKFSKANLVAKGDNKSIPATSSWKLSANTKYVHYCDNETIGGVEFKVFNFFRFRTILYQMAVQLYLFTVSLVKPYYYLPAIKRLQMSDGPDIQNV